MNKKRPRERMDPGDTLCRPLLTKGECLFGAERCRFSHDIAGYLKRKEKVRAWAWVCSWLVGLGAWGSWVIKYLWVIIIKYLWIGTHGLLFRVDR